MIASLLSMFSLAWWPFWVVIALFIASIVSAFLLPNRLVSKDKHDNKF